MRTIRKQPLRWLATLACACALSACGGGGGGGGDEVAPTPAAADTRNGTYQMFAADGREYVLSIDFDTRRYRVTGNGQDLQGVLGEGNTAGQFDFDPATAAPPPGSPRFTWFSDTMVGGFRFPAGTVPFIAARSFVTTVAEAAGTYNFLGTTVDPPAAPINSVFSAELLASGTMRTCNDATVFTIALCPPASVLTANLSVSGSRFVSDAGTGSYPFRIARVGSDLVFLRASTGTGTSHRFWVGMPERVFAGGTFSGENTNAEMASTVVSRTAYSANWSNGSANFIRSGTAGVLGASSPTGIISINAGADGLFRAMHDSELLVLVASRSNTTWPGYLEIGRR